jgi:hypothetical protein
VLRSGLQRLHHKPVNYENFATAILQLGLFLSVIQIPDSAL